MSWTPFNPPIVLIGKGTFICEKCKGPKKMLRTKTCAKSGCRMGEFRKMSHRIVVMNRCKRAEAGKPIVCPECAAEVPFRSFGKMTCPRCGLEI